jgi:hypothetical protein
LKQRAKRRCPESVDELKQIIQKEWDKIT